MDGAGVDRAILVQAFGAYRYDNNYVADVAAQYPDRFAAVCIVDVLKPDAADRLSYWVKDRGVKGLRVVTWTEPETMLDDPRINPVWRRAADLRIPVCILTNFHQLSRLARVLERFPELHIRTRSFGTFLASMTPLTLTTSSRSLTSHGSRTSMASSPRGRLPPPQRMVRADARSSSAA